MKSKNSLIILATILSMMVFITGAFAIEMKDLIDGDQLARIKAVKSARSIGTLELGGLTGQMEIVYVVPDKIYTVTDLSILRLVQAYDGRTAWMEDQNGQILELSGMEKQNLVTGAYMAGMSYMFDDRMPGEVTYLADTTIKEEDYYLFSAFPENGDTLWLYINKNSNRLEVVRERLDEIDVMTYLLDFRVVDGIEMPFVSRTESAIQQLNSVITTTSIEFDVDVDPSLFQVGLSDEKDYFFPENVDSVVVPFTLYGGHIYIDVSVNGLPAAKFILDSGAGINVINKPYAEEIGLKSSGELPAKGVAGYGTASVAPLDSMSIGGVSLYRQVAGIIDFGGGSLEKVGDIGGIMGFDLMHRFPFRLDFKNNRLVFYNPESFTPPDSMLSVDFELHLKVPLVTAQYNDTDGRFLVDFGNALGLILHKSFVEKNDLETTFTEVQPMKGGVGGVGGESDAVAAVGTAFKLGHAEIRNPTLMVAGGTGGLMDSREVDGNIGNLVFRDFSIIMDYKNKKMYILPLP